MALKDFERRVERLVEGAFSRAFRSGLRPVELGRKVSRLLDDERTVDVRGRTVGPNRLDITLAPDDYTRFGPIADALTDELAQVAREHGAERGIGFMGPVTVTLAQDQALRLGRCEVTGRFEASTSGHEPGSLVGHGGHRHVLGRDGAVLGRMSTCDIVVDDPKVSRRHVEITAVDDGFMVCDLGSTNGTRLNGAELSAASRLTAGDRIELGGHEFVYEVG